MRSRKWGVIGAVLALLLGVPVLACGQSLEQMRTVVSLRYPEVRWVTPRQLAAWMRSDEARPTLLLDARQPDEYRVSHLRGARRIDPDEPEIEGLSAPRDARVVVYCAVGWRSGDIASRLQDAGYREVYNLEGGIFAWANQGRPVYRDGERVREVHPYDETWGRLLDRRLHARSP
jgi:rhodanese-related sulfurtransferase